MKNKERRIVLTDFVKNRMAHFGFDGKQTTEMVRNSKKVEIPGDVIRGFLKPNAYYIQSGPYFFQVVERNNYQIVIGLNLIVFTNHARERMKSFRLTEEEVIDYLTEAIEMPEAMGRGASHRYKNVNNKDKTYKFGPFVFGVSEDRSDWVLATVYDQRIDLPSYDPSMDPIYLKKLNSSKIKR